MPKVTVCQPASNIRNVLRLLISRPERERFLIDYLRELVTMMSAQDRDMLVKLEPDLMESVLIVGSDLLARLRARGALTNQQKEHIKVIKQYYYKISFNFRGTFLFKST